MTLPMHQRNRRPADVARWDPFEELQQQIAQVFQDLPALRTGLAGEFVPLADVEETDDAFIVELELPGVRKEDVNIEVAGRRVLVTGERKEKERKGILRHQTRTVGRFHYEIMLPAEVDDDNVEASLREGVLTLRIPKPTADKPKRIDIR
jgi:HSP20 family protein